MAPHPTTAIRRGTGGACVTWRSLLPPNRGSTLQSWSLRSRVGSGKNRAHHRVLRRRHSATRLAPFLRWWSPTGIGKGVPEMCGVVVMLGLAGRKADTAILTRMAQRLAHRGPDDSGL